MIKVTVKYFNILAAYAGHRSQIIEIDPGASLSDLILSVSRINPPEFQAVILPEGEPSPHLRVFRNNQLIDREWLKTVLADGDEILLFPAVAGGAQVSSIRPTLSLMNLRGGRGDKIGFPS